MNFSLNPEQLALKEEIINFAKATLNKGVKQRDQTQTFDRRLWKKCGNLAIPGLAIPREYGGRGLDPLSTVIALEALGYGCEDGGLCFAIAAHLFACAVPLWKHGSGDLKKQYLPVLCNGQAIGAIAITENTSGSDVFSMSATAQPTSGGYLLNGRKKYVTNAPVADIILVYTLTDAKKRPLRRIFCLPSG